MWRIGLILLFLGMFWWAVRGLVRDLREFLGRKGASGTTLGTEELVEDPVCGVYCPKSRALSLRFRGRTYYFCSEECRRAFREASV
ncbi:MAG: TRASH domain protein [Thermodesulfatator sp.]|nr:MAG: TRASH domain protein [Thermodesulfatator sp.]